MGGGLMYVLRGVYEGAKRPSKEQKIGSGVGQMCQKDTPPPSGYRLFKIILGKCASKHGKHTEIFFPHFFLHFPGWGQGRHPRRPWS